MTSCSRPLLFLLLAFVLLFAQQGAAVHAVSHLAGSMPGHSQQDKQLPHSPACEKCVVYAGVGSAVAASGLNFLLVPAVAAHFVAEPASRLAQPCCHYLSRAPPTLV